MKKKYVLEYNHIPCDGTLGGPHPPGVWGVCGVWGVWGVCGIPKDPLIFDCWNVNRMRDKISLKIK